MFVKIVVGIVLVLALFLGYVSTKSGKFSYERSGIIHAPAEKIFPYLSQFRLGEQWSPYDKPEMKLTKRFSEVDGQVGSSMEFEGKKEGSGKLEILGMVPNQSVDIKLTMLKPFFAENLVQYKLTPEAEGTKFSWTMSGDGGFLGKLMATVIDCEKMIGGQFSEGIANLKTVVEAQK